MDVEKKVLLLEFSFTSHYCGKYRDPKQLGGEEGLSGLYFHVTGPHWEVRDELKQKPGSKNWTETRRMLLAGLPLRASSVTFLI